jgi:hypothetical protein
MNTRIPIRIHRRGPARLAPQPTFGICPAKTRRSQSSEFGNESHSKGYHLFSLNLAPLRLGGSNFRIRVSSATESFAKAAQILNYSNTELAESEDFLIKKSLLRALCDSAVQSLSPASRQTEQS